MAPETALAHDSFVEQLPSPSLRDRSHQKSQSQSLRSNATDALRLISELADLLPGGYLRPGTSLEIKAGIGQTSLLLHLLSAPTARGSWATIIGFPDINAHAAVECGVALERLAFIPDPGPSWLTITAALLDAVDLVVLSPPCECRPSDARRLLALARQRRSVLILIDGNTHRGPRNRPPRRLWPETPDVVLTTVGNKWHGLGQGHGCLNDATITVNATGRRLNGPARSCRLHIGQPTTLPIPTTGPSPSTVPTPATGLW